jgi:hypothetical protein
MAGCLGWGNILRDYKDDLATRLGLSSHQNVALFHAFRAKPAL